MRRRISDEITGSPQIARPQTSIVNCNRANGNGRLGLRNLGSANRSFSGLLFRGGGSIPVKALGCDQSLSLFSAGLRMARTDSNIGFGVDASFRSDLDWAESSDMPL